jgi:hypothetical protein
VHWHVVGRNEISRYEGENNDLRRPERVDMCSGPA